MLQRYEKYFSHSRYCSFQQKLASAFFILFEECDKAVRVSPLLPLLDPQVEASEDGLGAEMEHGVHLARHREAALLAAARLAAYRYRVFRAVGEHIVGYPAAFLEIEPLHTGQARLGVHHVVALLLVADDGVDDLFALVLRQSQALGAGEGGVEVERYRLDVGARLNIVEHLRDAVAVEGVHRHGHRQRLVTAASHVLLQAGKGAFAPHGLVVFPDAVEAHPDAVGPAAGKGKLSVGSDGAGIESQLMGKVAQVVDRLVAIAPQKGFAALEINEPLPQRMAVFQLLANLLVALAGRVGVVVDGAMFARKVAPVGDEQHALHRCPAAEEPCPYKPLCQIAHLRKLIDHSEAFLYEQ